MRHINLEIPEHSYFFGFAQTDGSFTKSTRNRGKLQIEVGKGDLHILKSFQKLFPYVYSSIKKRRRNTNFKNNYESYVLAIFNQEFRREINILGLPYGKKSNIISFPEVQFCERDYLRGLLDGDGSVGITKKGYPFISFTVKSEALKNYFFNILERVIQERKRVVRNKRDDIYNIMLNREKAQQFMKYLYYSDCLALKRKLKNVKKALRWKRPKVINRVFKDFWEPKDDEYILNHSIQESFHHLNRTERSVKMRLWRLKNHKAPYLDACLNKI